MESVRWNIAVSPDTDQSVRMFIAAQGGGRKGDLSRFIEEAVRFGRICGSLWHLNQLQGNQLWIKISMCAGKPAAAGAPTRTHGAD